MSLALHHAPGPPRQGRRPPAAVATRSPGNEADAPRAYARAHRRRFVLELASLLRFASVGAEPRRRAELGRCARWLSAHLRGIGLTDVRVLEGHGPPAVFGAWLARPGARTLLVYGHYDVQPPDPDARLPPFSPSVRDGALHARGASDNKGQLFAYLKAIEAWLASRGSLPVNIKVLLEGEEEVGSPHFADLLREHAATLAADLVAISDTHMPAPGQPAITLSLRGQIGVDVTIGRPGRALHSGVNGGAAPDPAAALARALASLHAPNGRVAVPGFYDDVRPFAPLPGDASSPAARAATRPAIVVTRLAAGAGGRAALASTAHATLDVRLLPGQEPAQIAKLVRAQLSRYVPAGLELAMRTTNPVPAFCLPADHPALAPAARAMAAGFGKPPTLRRSGGSIAPAALLSRALAAPVLLLGFGLPTDRIHGPDERMELRQLFAGIDMAITLCAEIARS